MLTPQWGALKIENIFKMSKIIKSVSRFDNLFRKIFVMNFRVFEFCSYNSN